MAEETRNYQLIPRASNFAVHGADGYVTNFVTKLTGVAFQITYWSVDGTPAAEDNTVAYDHPEHYKLTVGHTLETAVQMNPAMAYLLARTILYQLADMSEEEKARHRIPGTIPLIPGLRS